MRYVHLYLTCIKRSMISRLEYKKDTLVALSSFFFSNLCSLAALYFILQSIPALAGYSLAGLFAVYALYRTDLFRRAASASGSFWYPSFADYAETHDFAAKPDAVSLSLGDREADARQPVLATVAQQTERIAALFRARGVPVQFVWNAGNHFQEPARRLASCICGMLTL